MANDPRPHVTDHAVLRFLERVHGVDVEAARRHIAGRCTNGNSKGAVGVLADGVRYVIRNSCVVTVLLPHMPQSLVQAEERDD